MSKRVMEISALVVLFLLLWSVPLLADEQLMTKIYFDNLLKTATTPVENEINSLKQKLGELEQSVSALKRQLVTEIKVTIGKSSALIDGNPVPMEVPPALKNNRTMVPVRFIGEAFGAKFAWDDTTRKVTYTLDNVNIEVFIGKKTARLNGQSITLDAEPVIINGRTMVPLRFVGQYMGATFEWDAATQTAIILR